MKYTEQEVNEIVRKNRAVATVIIFFAWAFGVLAGRCSGTNQPIRDVKSGVVVSDSARNFQHGDMIKVILTNQKQR